MTKIYLGLGFFLGVLLIWWAVMRVRRGLGIWKLRHFALPREWLGSIHANVPLYEKLPWELRAPVQDKVINFIDNKFWRRAGNLAEVTTEIQVTIATYGSIMLANSPNARPHDNVIQIFVYPQSIYDSLRADHAAPPEPPTETSVPLVWDETQKVATDLRDFQNESLAAAMRTYGLSRPPHTPDGALGLRFSTWARARHDDWIRFLSRQDRAAEGTEDRDHFIAAIEAFFIAPAALEKQKRPLYETLRLFLKLDPARWTLRHS
jgi:MtfA peptidase